MFRRRSTDHAEERVERPEPTDEGHGPVNLLRYLHPACIELDLDFRPTEPREDETDAQREKRLTQDKEAILQELVDILDRSGEISNPTRFYKDILHRERKATTAIAPDIAIPHVRSQQAKRFVLGFARSRDGVPFGSLDGGDTKLFLMLTSPPWEDKLYLKVYREFAEMIQYDWVKEAFLDAETPNDVIGILRGYVTK